MDKSSEEIKNRAKFSSEQLKTLESFYDRYEFIDDNITRHLAEELAVTKRQIRNWFQNKRAAIRRRKFKESGASYPLVKNGHHYSWRPFANKACISPQLTGSVDSNGSQNSPRSQTLDEASGGVSPSRSYTGSCPSTSGGSSPSRSYTGSSPSASFYASSDTSACSSYGGSPGKSPKPSGSNASQEKSPLWTIESFVASTTPFLTPIPSYHPRLSSPSKLSTYQPSMDNWRPPLSELSLNNSQTESNSDVSPEEEYPSSSFQMFVTPPIGQDVQDMTDLTDIDWTFIGDQNQMAEVDDWNDLNRLGNRSSGMVPKMAVAHSEEKTYYNLDTKSMGSNSSCAESCDIDDAQITSIISELEVDYDQDHKVGNILNFLKND